MIKLFKKGLKQTQGAQGDSAVLKVSGMNCVSCAMNIDAQLEEIEGVFSADTQFASSKTVVDYDSQLTDTNQMISVIKELGYQAEKIPE